MPYKNKEYDKARRREKYAIDPVYREKYKERKRLYRLSKANHFNKLSRAYNIKTKIQVLTYYGPNGVLQCSWPECNVIDIDMLTLDHVDNSGAGDRRTGRRYSGVAFYGRLRKEGFPPRFQTLCANHQLKKDLMRRRGEL
jgi:hypothetical protein